MGPSERKNFKRHILWKNITDSLSNIYAYFYGGYLPRFVQWLVKVKFWICAIFSFSLTWEHMGEKNQTTYCLKVYSRYAAQNLGILLRRVSPKLCKELWKFKFLILTWILTMFLFFFFFFFLAGLVWARLIWESMWIYKMCDIVETGGHRVKRTKIWDWGTLVTHVWCTFDLVVFQVILESCSALVSKWPVIRKRLVVEQNGVKFETRVDTSNTHGAHITL